MTQATVELKRPASRGTDEGPAAEKSLLARTVWTVLRRDIVYTLIPLFVSVVITVFATKSYGDLALKPEMLFASIVFLGLALTQLNIVNGSTKPGRDSDPAGAAAVPNSMSVMIYLLLIVAVLLLGMLLLQQQTAGSRAGSLASQTTTAPTVATPAPDDAPAVASAPETQIRQNQSQTKASPTLLITAGWSIFFASIFILIRINFQRERRLHRRNDLPSDLQFAEYADYAKESADTAARHIAYLTKTLKTEHVQRIIADDSSTTYSETGFDRRGLAFSIGQMLDLAEELEKESVVIRRCGRPTTDASDRATRAVSTNHI